MRELARLRTLGSSMVTSRASIAVLAFVLVSGTWMLTAGCGGAKPEAEAPAAASSAQSEGVRLLPPGDTPQFRFRAIDGREVSSDKALGRNTVVAFIATFDWASQAQARFLSGIERNHKPRTNCFAIVVDQEENATIVDAFVGGLSLRYPVAHVPADRLLKTSFEKVRTVPSVLVLDAGGNVVWRSRGLATEDTLEEVLGALEAGAAGAKP